MSIRNLAVSTFVALALAGVGLPASAQTTPAPAKKMADANKDGKVSTQEKADARAKYEATFKAADKNGDGGLSKAELGDGKSFPQIRANFDAMDANKDGKVTLVERDAWAKANAAAKKK